MNAIKNSYLSKIFISMDFVGPLYSLEVDDSTRFKTMAGAIVSLLAIMSVTVLSILFGKELLMRKAPIITIRQESKEFSLINFKEFPIFFQFDDLNGIPVEEIFSTLTPLITRTNMSESNRIFTSNNDINLVDCRKKLKDFTKYKSYIEKKFLDYKGKLYCLDFNNETYFKNGYYSSDSLSYDISFLMPFKYMEKFINYNHLNDSYNKNFDEYNFKKEINKIDFSNNKIKINEILLGINYINSFVDVNDLQNPVSTDWETLNIQLSPYYYKRGYMRFTTNNIITDYGYILEDKRDVNFTTLQSFVPDDMLMLTNIDSCAECDGPLIFSLTLESPKLRTSVLRVYMKMQDLFAKIGGMTNAVLICSKIISYHYLRFLYVFFLKNLTNHTIKTAKINDDKNAYFPHKNLTIEDNKPKPSKKHDEIRSILRKKYLENVIEPYNEAQNNIMNIIHEQFVKKHQNETKNKAESNLNLNPKKISIDSNFNFKYKDFESKSKVKEITKIPEILSEKKLNKIGLNPIGLHVNTHNDIYMIKLKEFDFQEESDFAIVDNGKYNTCLQNSKMSEEDIKNEIKISKTPKSIDIEKLNKSSELKLKEKMKLNLNKNHFDSSDNTDHSFSKIKIKSIDKENKSKYKAFKTIKSKISNIDDLNQNKYDHPVNDKDENLQNSNGIVENEEIQNNLNSMKRRGASIYNPYTFNKFEKEQFEFNDGNFGYLDLIKSYFCNKQRYKQYMNNMNLLKQAINFDLMTNMIVCFYSTYLD